MADNNYKYKRVNVRKELQEDGYINVRPQRIDYCDGCFFLSSTIPFPKNRIDNVDKCYYTAGTPESFIFIEDTLANRLQLKDTQWKTT